MKKDFIVVFCLADIYISFASYNSNLFIINNKLAFRTDTKDQHAFLIEYFQNKIRL